MLLITIKHAVEKFKKLADEVLAAAASTDVAAYVAHDGWYLAATGEALSEDLVQLEPAEIRRIQTATQPLPLHRFLSRDSKRIISGTRAPIVSQEQVLVCESELESYFGSEGSPNSLDHRQTSRIQCRVLARYLWSKHPTATLADMRLSLLRTA
jgi:hypothetical protein